MHRRTVPVGAGGGPGAGGETAAFDADGEVDPTQTSPRGVHMVDTSLADALAVVGEGDGDGEGSSNPDSASEGGGAPTNPFGEGQPLHVPGGEDDGGCVIASSCTCTWDWLVASRQRCCTAVLC